MINAHSALAAGALLAVPFTCGVCCPWSRLKPDVLWFQCVFCSPTAACWLSHVRPSCSTACTGHLAGTLWTNVLSSLRMLGMLRVSSRACGFSKPGAIGTAPVHGACLTQYTV